MGPTVKPDPESEPELSNSQTSEDISTMVDKKAMVLPGSRDAPKFSSTRPKELRRFIRLIKDLWKEAGVTSDKEKKESLGKYADQELNFTLSHVLPKCPGPFLNVLVHSLES
jgi:hypothetical protein